ncbi:MAG TPA: carboxymuconolactone decarboxylase family protein [Actinocrinis sp.]|uniref:carboxymuconolactone decarboxylase family protein n=1 Tax=Actinocrinis sp. TaxID=1920516 RepID=UPI002DDDA2F4|nr:carboxymuconolactone decarboxylase family protein [Actinocrinis sp.]HEV2345929.1 carboxymuconolactone decarboxylase family protein [Actinocrinis sp.]
MAHIDLGLDETEFPGIIGLLKYRPETAKPLSELTGMLLRGANTLRPGERELIAAHVSGLNDCEFCRDAHSAFAAAQLEEGMPLVLSVRASPQLSAISPKLKALLAIAGAVRESGRSVTTELVEAARAEGATDLEIHDTVLIAAAFCMVNRYVDGLGTLVASSQEAYAQAAQRVVKTGYVN